MTTARPRARAATIALACAISATLLTGCVAGPRTLATDAQRILAPLPAVDAVRTGRGTVDVTLIDTATDDDAARAADATRRLVAEHAGRDATVRSARIVVDVFPGTEPGAAGDTVRAALTASRAPGVLSVSVRRGWPSVSVSTVAELAPVVAATRDAALFSTGATYLAEEREGRVRLTRIAEQVSDSAVATILALASRYPEPQFWLESPTQGPASPTLYVDKATEQQAAAIAAALSDPALAAENGGVRTLPYVVSWVGPSGRTDLTGTVGGVPE